MATIPNSLRPRHTGKSMKPSSSLNLAPSSFKYSFSGLAPSVTSSRPLTTSAHTILNVTRDRFKRSIRVLVGCPNPEEYTVHRDLICSKSPFFRSACNGRFSEGQSGVVKLPEDNPGIFELFLFWLYSGRLGEDWAEITSYKYDLLAGLYIFADKVQIPVLKNCAIEALIEKKTQSKTVPDSYIARNYDSIPPNSGLRKLLVDFVAWSAKRETVERAGFSRDFLLDLSVTMMSIIDWGLCKPHSDPPYIARLSKYYDRLDGEDGSRNGSIQCANDARPTTTESSAAKMIVDSYMEESSSDSSDSVSDLDSDLATDDIDASSSDNSSDQS